MKDERYYYYINDNENEALIISTNPVILLNFFIGIVDKLPLFILKELVFANKTTYYQNDDNVHVNNTLISITILTTFFLSFKHYN